MTLLEKKMVALLKELKSEYSVAGLKMEFEAEGTRLEEAMRLKEIATQAQVSLTTKVGGCEAISDMYLAGSVGTKYLVGPMVESAYALKKFIQSVRMSFTDDQREEMEFYINLETITACENFDKMLAIPEAQELDGIVLGRVDLTGSMGLDRKSVDSPEVLTICKAMAEKAKAKGKKVIIGGAVSVNSMPFFKQFPVGHIDKYETRKVVFACPNALNNPDAAFALAAEFELLWLKNKKNHYGRIYQEDDKRIQMMEERQRLVTATSAPVFQMANGAHKNA